MSADDVKVGACRWASKVLRRMDEFRPRDFAILPEAELARLSGAGSGRSPASQALQLVQALLHSHIPALNPKRLPKTALIPAAETSGLALLHDIAAEKAAGERDEILDPLVTLQNACLVPDAKKRSRRPGRGLWFVDALEELIRILQVREAEILLLRHAVSGEIFGLLSYQTQCNELAEFDRPFMDHIRGHASGSPALQQLLAAKRTGVVHVIAIRDHAAAALGLARGRLCAHMQAYAVHEGLAQHADTYIAICRTRSTENTAIYFFEDLGWRPMPVPPYEMQDPIVGRTLYWQPIQLDLRSDLQKALISYFIHSVQQAEIQVLDEEDDEHFLPRRCRQFRNCSGTRGKIGSRKDA